MFGALRRRRGLQVARRSKGRVAAWIATVVVVAIVIGEVAADVVNSSGPASVMSDRTYAAAVVPIIDESTALLPWLTDVRTKPVSLGRVGIESALGHLVSGSANVELQLAQLDIAPPSARAGSYLSETFAARTAAARQVTGGIAQAIGPTAGEGAATASLLAAAADLQRSDDDYRRFLDSLPRYVTRSVALPASQWYEAAEWSPTAVSSFASLLGSTAALKVNHSLLIVAVTVSPPDLRITGLPTTTTTTTTTTTSTTTTSTTTTTTTTLPGVTTSSTLPTTTTSSTTTTSTTTTTTTMQIPPPGSVSFYPPTSHLSVEVVIANAGDVPASDVRVGATLTPVAASPPGKAPAGHKTSTTTTLAGPVLHSAATSSVIAALAAGRSVDVTLPALSCQAGGRYVLEIKVGDDVESFTLQVAAD